jgi:hypothetical protein
LYPLLVLGANDRQLEISKQKSNNLHVAFLFLLVLFDFDFGHGMHPSDSELTK